MLANIINHLSNYHLDMDDLHFYPLLRKFDPFFFFAKNILKLSQTMNASAADNNETKHRCSMGFPWSHY